MAGQVEWIVVALGRLKSRRGKAAYVIKKGDHIRREAMGFRHLGHQHLETWIETKNEWGFRGGAKGLRVEDKIICLWFTTDLYLFEGDKHAQIQDIRHCQNPVSLEIHGRK